MRFGPAVAIAAALSLLAACFAPAASGTGTLTPVPLIGGDARVGGLSGLEVSETGDRFTAISDRGYMLTGGIDRDEAGSLRARIGAIERIRHLDGSEYPADRPLIADAEGLALFPDGRLAISFEEFHRVFVYQPNGRALRMPFPPKSLNMARNNGFEALAVDPEGRLVALPEGGGGDRTAPVMRLMMGGWHVVAEVNRADRFRPVGADFGPDGLLYLLERKVTPLGFRSRIRRFDLSRPGLLSGETLWAPHRSFGNLEALSIWTDKTGRLHAMLLADDNYSAFMSGGMYDLPLAAADEAM
ncbi:esterase-like activity of phytase family protein [Pseudooceanicola sp. C21-150M6]|uniref:esterase-like activity of phytase family protein n=1 Tax=Pseudooceanicola sp. C21-150M6 TaxID=3434355 RepID=UPI003D7F21E1